MTVYQNIGIFECLWTFITSSKYPRSESKVVGVYGLTTSSPRLSFPLLGKTIKGYHMIESNGTQ